MRESINPIVESTVYPTAEFLQNNGEKLDDFAGGEATYAHNGQSWYVRWDGTVAPLVDEDSE